jgi:hypothetical protein
MGSLNYTLPLIPLKLPDGVSFQLHCLAVLANQHEQPSGSEMPISAN